MAIDESNFEFGDNSSDNLIVIQNMILKEAKKVDIDNVEKQMIEVKTQFNKLFKN